MAKQYCPVCAEEVILPIGSQHCSYIIIEEFPELVLPAAPVNSWKKDEWTPKKILDNELKLQGMVVQQFRIVNVYPHMPPDEGLDFNCYDSGFKRAVDECIGNRGVVVLGGNLCKEMTGYELKQVMGLSEVESQYLPDLNVPRVFLPNMKSLYSTEFGEFRLGLQRFASQLQQGE